MMLQRLALAFLGATSAINGAAMLVAGPVWYEAVPGVAATGPYNPHFIADIGAAFLVSGAALGAAAVNLRLWPAALTGAGFLAAHAAIHGYGLVAGHSRLFLFETGAIILPALLALWAVLSSRGERHG